MISTSRIVGNVERHRQGDTRDTGGVVSIVAVSTIYTSEYKIFEARALNRGSISAGFADGVTESCSLGGAQTQRVRARPIG